MNLLRPIFKAFGYDLIRSEKAARREARRTALGIEQQLAKVLAKLDINCVIDVGANEGQYGTLLRELGYKGRIVSFEPVSSCFERLREIAERDSDWHVYPLALGSETCSKEINQTENSVLSSFLVPSEQARQHLAKESPIVQKETVSVRRLDDLFSDLIEGLSPARCYLKMDTQGFDLEVFRGATSCLPEILGLQSELSFVPLYQGMPDYTEALAAFQAAGFQATGFYPIWHLKDLLIVEADCVMVRGKILKPAR
jgi:FkbM family methyltransferase